MSDSQGRPAIKVRAALKERKKSEIIGAQDWYYSVTSPGITRYTVRSEACSLLAVLAQEIIGIDRSNDSEVFRVTRGIS